MHKQAKGPYTASGIVSAKAGWYFGFTYRTGGANRFFGAWDSPTTVAGQCVEAYDVDGNKTTDGHEHSIPIYCASGLYIGVDGGQALIYFVADVMKS